MKLLRFLIVIFVVNQSIFFTVLAMNKKEKEKNETTRKQYFHPLVIPKSFLLDDTPENITENAIDLKASKNSPFVPSLTIPNIPIKSDRKIEEESSVENSSPENFADLKPLKDSPFVPPLNIPISQSQESETESKSKNGSGSESKSENYDDSHIYHLKNTPLYDTENFIGQLPAGSKYILDCFKHFSSIQEMFPILIKIVGPAFSGKTTFVQHIAKKAKCNDSQYLEIGSLNEINEIKKTLNAKGIDIKQLPSELNTLNKKTHVYKRKDLEAIIMAFYLQKANSNMPYIIHFTKGLGLNDTQLGELRKSITQIKKRKKKGTIAPPLTIFYETRSTGLYNKNFIDEIFYILPPSPEDIKAILIATFTKAKCLYEEIKPEILVKIQYPNKNISLKKKSENDLFVETSEEIKNPQLKTLYTPAPIFRIAEKIVRKAKLKGETLITNERILKVLMNRDD